MSDSLTRCDVTMTGASSGRDEKSNGRAVDRPAVALDEVLAYKNKQVIKRFLKLYDVPQREAKELFRETKKFLWASSQTSHPLEPPLIIDEMWHNFILFTRPYTDFCQQHFGYFIHHQPADKAGQKEKDPVGFRQRSRSNFEARCGILFELLGEETVVKWYLEYPLVYDASFFRKRFKPPTPRRLDYDVLKAN